jgi:hypothetical protein
MWNFLWLDKKKWPFNTGDCLIEVTTWAGLTVIAQVYLLIALLTHPLAKWGYKQSTLTQLLM